MNARLTTTVPVVDMARAKRFYQTTLGLRHLGDFPTGEAMFQSAYGDTVTLYARSATKADHTVLAFVLPSAASFDAAMGGLRGRGVKFEEYDLPGLKTVNGVLSIGSMRAAWFKDTEGNILGLATG